MCHLHIVWGLCCSILSEPLPTWGIVSTSYIRILPGQTSLIMLASFIPIKNLLTITILCGTTLLL